MVGNHPRNVIIRCVVIDGFHAGDTRLVDVTREERRSTQKFDLVTWIEL